MPVSIDQSTFLPLAKAAIDEDKPRFVRLVATTLTRVFLGPLAAGVVDSIAERLWARSSQVKFEAAKEKMQRAEELEQTIATALKSSMSSTLAEHRALLETLLGRSERQQTQLETILSAVREQGRARDLDRSVLIDLFDEVLDKLTAIEAPATASPATVVLVSAADVEVPPYANHAEISFTVHNLGPGPTKLTELHFEVDTREELDDVELPLAGQPVEEFELQVDLRGQSPRTYDLLLGARHQFILKPQDADAFRLEVLCDDGYRYGGRILATLVDVASQLAEVGESPRISIRSSVRSLDTLKERRRR